MIPEKSGLLRHALPNDTRTDDEAEFIYQRSSEKANPKMNNRGNQDTSRMAANPLKQPPSQPSGLAAAMNNPSKQETMMPGHRMREKASGISSELFIERKDSIVRLGNALKKPAVQSPSSLTVKQSANPNETDAFDTSDELLDDLVKNATLTASRDALKQRKTGRYGAQRRSRKSTELNFPFNEFLCFSFQYVEHFILV